MTANKRDDEIKRALIADAFNPDAWERVAVVPPSASPRPVWYGKSRKVELQSRIGEPRATSSAGGDEALRRKHLLEAIAALPEGQRDAILLWLDGLQPADIALALRVSVDTMKSRLDDAKRRLGLNLDERS
jgi:DNA-directed RNA polymerase specialized sigma24 family protein